MSQTFDIESAVRSRYSQAAQQRVDALCCPIDYDRKYLQVIPQEILDRDYGCGDPSRHLRPGEIVLDLGCGAGKICFIASQVIGPQGRVIGVDLNDDMLALARRHQQAVGDAIGWHNIDFRRGRIQDLALDLDRLDAELRRGAALPGMAANANLLPLPVRHERGEGRGEGKPGRNDPPLPSPLLPRREEREAPEPAPNPKSTGQPGLEGADAFLAADSLADELRLRHPLIPADSIDVVISNCVLNLVDPRAKSRLFHEIFRVLRQTGRAVISDIVSDKPVPAALQQDPELWSGCIAGALTQDDFLQAFTDAGFHSLRLLALDAAPWRTVQGLEFRSMTVEAFKGAAGQEGTTTAPSQCCDPGRCC